MLFKFELCETKQPLTNEICSSGLVINQIFNEYDISCKLKIKCADGNESTLLHKIDQGLLTLRHIIPLHRQ